MRLIPLLLAAYPFMAHATLVVKKSADEVPQPLIVRAIEPAGTLKDCLTAKNVPTLYPGSEGYKSLVVPYNLRLIYTPVAIVIPTANQQISDAVVCAGKSNIKVQAKSGGHSYASYSSGGKNGSLIVDLQLFQSVTVEASGRANIDAGIRLGDLALALYNNSKRALPHANHPGIGFGGHATHGGYGFTSRQWGLTIDTVTGCTVILANGSIIYTSPSPDSYSDIHWALLGAADSFGIITSFEVQTLPAPSSIVNWAYSIPSMYDSAEIAAAAFEHIQNFAQNASIIDNRLAFRIRMDATSFKISGTYLGDEATFKQTIAPALLANLPTPAQTTINTTDWLTLLSIQASPIPLQQPTTAYNLHDDFFVKSIVVPSSSPLTAKALDSYFSYIVSDGIRASNPWYITIDLYGGPSSAINTPPSNASAYGDRSALWVIQHYGSTSNTNTSFPFASLTFIEGLNNALTSAMPETQFGAYLNYVGSSLSADVAHELYYGAVATERLERMKKVVDPGQVFWNPQSIGN